MTTKVWRPEIKLPDLYRLEVDESILYHLISGLKEVAADLRYEIRQHEEKCGDNPTFCQLRYESLITEYGSIEEAVKNTGLIVYDCMQDLANLYTQLGQVAETIFKIQDLQNHRDATGEDPDLTDWRPQEKLKEIKDEVAYREEAARADTGFLDRINDDEVDSDPPKKNSLLGLTERLPKLRKSAGETNPAGNGTDEK